MLFDRVLGRCLRCSFHSLLFAFVFVTTGAILERRAHAQDAKTLFDEGWALMEKNQFDEACAKFEQSMKASGATAAVQSLAECEGKRGRNAAAYNLWAQVASRLPEGNPDRTRATSKLTELASKVALLTVSIRPETPGAKVTVGNVEVKVGVEAALDPGRYTMVTEAPSRAPERRDVNLTPGRQSIEVAIGGATTTQPGGDGNGTQDVVVPPSTTPPTEEKGHPLLIAGIVVGAVGVVGVGVTIGTWVPMMGIQDDFDQKKITASQADDRMGSYSAINGIAFVTGIVGLGVGATLIIVDVATSGSSSTEPSSTVALDVGPSSVGLRGTF